MIDREQAKINSEYSRSMSEKDADIHATIQLKKAPRERRPERAICVKCGKVWPTSFMALVGLDCYECRRCLYA